LIIFQVCINSAIFPCRNLNFLIGFFMMINKFGVFFISFFFFGSHVFGFDSYCTNKKIGEDLHMQFKSKENNLTSESLVIYVSNSLEGLIKKPMFSFEKSLRKISSLEGGELLLSVDIRYIDSLKKQKIADENAEELVMILFKKSDDSETPNNLEMVFKDGRRKTVLLACQNSMP
jgi:hypothetical protein